MTNSSRINDGAALPSTAAATACPTQGSILYIHTRDPTRRLWCRCTRQANAQYINSYQQHVLVQWCAPGPDDTLAKVKWQRKRVARALAPQRQGFLEQGLSSWAPGLVKRLSYLSQSFSGFRPAGKLFSRSAHNYATARPSGKGTRMLITQK